MQMLLLHGFCALLYELRRLQYGNCTEVDTQSATLQLCFAAYNLQHQLVTYSVIVKHPI